MAKQTWIRSGTALGAWSVIASADPAEVSNRAIALPLPVAQLLAVGIVAEAAEDEIRREELWEDAEIRCGEVGESIAHARV